MRRKCCSFLLANISPVKVAHGLVNAGMAVLLPALAPRIPSTMKCLVTLLSTMPATSIRVSPQKQN